MSNFSYISTSEKQTQLLGQAIARFVTKDSLLLLKGDLGTGKTTLTQSIVKEIDSSIKVKSPTFVIAHEYRSELLIYHVDLYRIEDEIDFYSRFRSWPLRLKQFVPGSTQTDGLCFDNQQWHLKSRLQ